MTISIKTRVYCTFPVPNVHPCMDDLSGRTSISAQDQDYFGNSNDKKEPLVRNL